MQRRGPGTAQEWDHCSEGRKCLFSNAPPIGFAKNYLQFSFLEAFLLLLTELGILVELWSR